MQALEQKSQGSVMNNQIPPKAIDTKTIIAMKEKYAKKKEKYHFCICRL